MKATLIAVGCMPLLGGGLSLLAHKTKPSNSRIRFLSRELLSCGGDTEAISISILKEKCADSYTRPRARFDLHISSAPEELSISVCNIWISIGFVMMFCL